MSKTIQQRSYVDTPPLRLSIKSGFRDAFGSFCTQPLIYAAFIIVAIIGNYALDAISNATLSNIIAIIVMPPLFALSLYILAQFVSFGTHATLNRIKLRKSVYLKLMLLSYIRSAINLMSMYYTVNVAQAALATNNISAQVMIFVFLMLSMAIAAQIYLAIAGVTMIIGNTSKIKKAMLFNNGIIGKALLASLLTMGPMVIINAISPILTTLTAPLFFVITIGVFTGLVKQKFSWMRQIKSV